MRRVLTDELIHGQRAAAYAAGAHFIAADRLAGPSLAFIRHTEILPMEAEIQRQPWTEFPIVFEEQAHLVRVPVAVVHHVAVFITKKSCRGCVRKVEAFADAADGS